MDILKRGAWWRQYQGLEQLCSLEVAHKPDGRMELRRLQRTIRTEVVTFYNDQCRDLKYCGITKTCQNNLLAVAQE